MAVSKMNVVVCLVAFLIMWSSYAAESRELKFDENVISMARFEFAAAAGGSGGGLVECWNALYELKSCTNEIILFFINGQADIGKDCCKAIDIITKNCWPAMLTSIGFTAEEGNILRGYCDGSTPTPTPSTNAPAAAPLANH
ncbi:hypothetical protein ACFE04_017082 [Oxalis oulophora]